MTAITFFSNFLQAFLYPYFLSKTFQIKKSYQYISISFTIQFFILYFGEMYSGRSSLTTFIIFINILLTSLFLKKMNFNVFFMVIFYTGTILLSSLPSTFVKISYIQNINTITDFNFTNITIATIISNIILIGLTYFLTHRKMNLLTTLDLDYEVFILVFIATLLFLISIIGFSLVSQLYSNKILIFIGVVLIILLILFVILIYKISKLNKEKIQAIKNEQQNQFNNQKLYAIQNIKNEVENNEHRLFYILFQIEHHIQNKEYDKASSLIESHKNYVLKNKLFFDTSNAIFDYLLALKLNELSNEGIDITTNIFISQNSFYNDFEFINLFIDIIKNFQSSPSVQIIISEKDNFMISKIIYPSSQKLDEPSLQSSLDNFTRRYSGKYNSDFIEQGLLKILIPISKEN